MTPVRASRSFVEAHAKPSVRIAVALALTVASLMIGAPALGGPQRAQPALRRQTNDPIRYFFVPSLHSRPFMVTPGPDGNLWFTDTDASMIGRITPKGVVTEFDIGAGKKPYDIVAGPDGNLWFTEELNDKIGVVDVHGNLIHEYYAPGIDSRPAGITVGSDGNVWFTEMGSGEDITDAVGRITPDGTVTIFELQSCACFPIGITSGADGNIWAAEEEGVFNGNAPGTIDRISTDGQTIDRFAVPQEPSTPGHLPAFVSPGPDGNVWFTEYASDLHRIGKVTPKGHITEYTVPGPASNSIRIVTGPDGNLWVTQGDGNDIVVVGRGGALLQSYPTHHEPAGITVGPDGNVWFAAALDGEIGRIATAQRGTRYVLEIAPGFVQADRTVRQGGRVEWVLEAPGVHQVRDGTGLGLFDSGPVAAVSFETFRFPGAGAYPYVDPSTGGGGVISVPVKAPDVGQVGVPFSVMWAARAPGPDLVFDVQVKLPGGGAWQTWQSGVTTTNAAYTPGSAGSFQFRARVRNEVTSAASDWSPVKKVAVS